MIRTTYIIVWVVLTTIFWGTIAIIISFFTRTGNPIHNIARIWAKGILFASRIRVNVKGLTNIDPSQSYVYMSNHQSNFDIPVLLAQLPVQFRWLAKAELFKIPLFGRAMRGAGYVKIDRFNRESAFKSIDEAAEKMKNGVSVMIFPEGTRSRDGRIRPFKKGGFVMAVDAGVPLVALADIDELGFLGLRPRQEEWQAYQAQVERIIHRLAEEENAIIVGRGSQVALRSKIPRL